MKKKDKYALINYAINSYNKKLNAEYKIKKVSPKFLLDLLKKYNHSNATEWMYCCYGMYKSCWEEHIFDGNWGWDQEFVDHYIKIIICDLKKSIKRDSRVGIYEDEIGVHVVIVARDLPQKTDFFITFTNKEE